MTIKRVIFSPRAVIMNCTIYCARFLLFFNVGEMTYALDSTGQHQRHIERKSSGRNKKGAKISIAACQNFVRRATGRTTSKKIAAFRVKIRRDKAAAEKV